MPKFISGRLVVSAASLILVAALPFFFQNCASGSDGSSDASPVITNADPTTSCDPSSPLQSDGTSDGLCTCYNSGGVLLTGLSCAQASPTPTPIPGASATPQSCPTWAGVTIALGASPIPFYDKTTAHNCANHSMTVKCVLKADGVTAKQICTIPNLQPPMKLDCTTSPATTYINTGCTDNNATATATPTPTPVVSTPTPTPAPACTYPYGSTTHTFQNVGDTFSLWSKSSAAKCPNFELDLLCKSGGKVKETLGPKLKKASDAILTQCSKP